MAGVDYSVIPRARVKLSKAQMILAASISEDIADVQAMYAFSEITHEEMLNMQAQLEFRLDMVIQGEFPYGN